MFDPEVLSKQLSEAVKQAVQAEAHKLQGSIAINDAIVSALRKPVLTYPGDIQLVLGLGRTTLHHLVTDPVSDFPPISTVGRRQFVNKDAFLAWLESKEKAAA